MFSASVASFPACRFPGFQRFRQVVPEMSGYEGRVLRYLLVLRQLGVLVALVYLLGYFLGLYAPYALVEKVLLAVCGAMVTYYLFDRLVRVVLASRYEPSEGTQANSPDDVDPGLGDTRRNMPIPAGGPGKARKADKKHQRRVRRYLAIMRNLGVLVALVFLFGYLMGTNLPPVTEDDVWWAIFGLLGVFFVFDRLMRAVLGWKYRPPQEMADRLARRGKYDNDVKSPFYRVYFTIYYSLGIPALFLGIYGAFFHIFLYLFEIFGD